MYIIKIPTAKIIISFYLNNILWRGTSHLGWRTWRVLERQIIFLFSPGESFYFFVLRFGESKYLFSFGRKFKTFKKIIIWNTRKLQKKKMKVAEEKELGGNMFQTSLPDQHWYIHVKMILCTRSKKDFDISSEFLLLWLAAAMWGLTFRRIFIWAGNAAKGKVAEVWVTLYGRKWKVAAKV